MLRKVLPKNKKDRTGRTDLLYADFQKLNLSSIVAMPVKRPDDSPAPGGIGETTEIVSPWPVLQIERRQINALCCSLGLMSVTEEDPDLEALDALQRNLLSLCTDIGAKYGGYAAGALGDCMMMFFGYPQAGDNDARYAARTALEIAGQMRRRSALLAERQGVRPEFRIGVHSGVVTTCEGSPPSGVTPNMAFRLQNLAPLGAVLVSDSTCRLLERYIEFEPYESYPLAGSKPVQTFLLIGERQAEAFSFLHAGRLELPMVGRDAEFRALRELWENAAKKQGAAALLKGEPGIGKSRLAYEIRSLATDGGFSSIVCRCLPEYRNNALFPVLERLKSRLRLHEASSPDEAARRLEAALRKCDCRIDWSMPIFCSWLSMPLPEAFPPPPHSPQRQKQILLKVLEELILDTGRDDSPQMLIAEDLHWADQVSLELFERLAARIPDAPVLMILTARPEFAAQWETKKLRVIELDRISPADTESMIRKLTGGKAVDQSVLRAVYERTDGVPLFVEELVRMMLDRQHLVEKNNVFHLHERFDSSLVPITLQDLLNEKLGRLGPAKETAQTAAAIGREFDYSLLVAVSLRDEASVQTDLDQMVAADLIYRQRRVQGESFIFRHALIRDSAYNSMLQSARKQSHGRIATTLENDFPEQVKADPAGVAHHFAEAGIFGKAVHYGSRAASTALERSLNDETIIHARKALEWADKIEREKQPETKLAINNILTLAMMGKYGWADSRVKESAEMSKKLLYDMDKGEHIVPTLWSLAMYHHVASNRSEVRALTDELVKTSEKSGSKSLRAAAESFLGLRYQTDGQYVEAAQALEQAIRLYDPDPHGNHDLLFVFDTRVWAAGTLAIVYWFSGYNSIAAECGENAISWARELKHIPSLAIALLYRGLGHYHAGNKDGATRVIDELLDLAKKYGLPAFEGYATMIHCWITGNAELASNILCTLQQMGCRLGLSLYRTMLADIEAQHGNWDNAVAQIDKSIAMCLEIDEHVHEPVIHKLRAMFLLEKHPGGNPDIRASLIKASELGRTQGMFRVEAEAIYERVRVFGHDNESKSRLAEILFLRPEIGLSLT